MVGIVDAHARVQDLSDRERFAWAQVQSPQTHGSGVERHRGGIDGRDPKHGDEDPSARGQFDGETEHARLLSRKADGDDGIADTTDRLTIRTKDRQSD